MPYVFQTTGSSYKCKDIILDCPIDFNENDFLISTPNKEEVITLFSELEFNQLSKRLLGEDIEQNGVDPTQPPIFVDVDDDDIITGEHRGETSGNLGIRGWMAQFVRINEKDPKKRAWIKKRLAKALNNTRMFNQLNNY